ncbi:hypothetical protein MAR_003458 [Mya arenaria]|uniref:Uncharacterized protein n=1 Tax=Mya arenaria TaxID=6604 RepID=A0ABY7G630_MYAAR|nr:hypothetical protein MAR_003458 [Mya arenaria]
MASRRKQSYIYDDDTDEVDFDFYCSDTEQKCQAKLNNDCENLIISQRPEQNELQIKINNELKDEEIAENVMEIREPYTPSDIKVIPLDGEEVAVIKIIRVLRNPFQVKKRKIKTPLQLRVADIVAFRYYGLEHVAIISDITDVNEGSRSARVKCIHYGLRHLFAKREIVDEDFEMNLAVSSWHVYDVNGPHTYSRDERLSRARKRVGEKRWKITNRSDFLCHWATIKTTNEDDIFSEVHTDEKLPAGKKAITNTRNDNEENMPVDLLNTTPVCIAEELRLGDVVTFKNEKGILVKKKTTDDQQKEVLIYLIIPEYPIVKRIKYTVDLNTNDIYVLHYHPARCIPMQERVKRALFLEKKNVCPFMPVMHS